MPAVIRRAREGDERRVAELAIRLIEQHVDYDPDRFSIFATVGGAKRFYRSRFDSAGSVVIVAEKDREVVGFAYVERAELNYAELLENGAWLHDIYVDEAVRREGIGKGLVKAAAE